ncbi:sensor histidine kinase KdpD [Cyanobium sp. Morenito 9A2]|uniref:sensor histidine kinase n=1 Tax=Cyanobium sp. Morenito 9A2 TaxID=2823718 RepID=UPI0020CF72CD|nr:sensor histidine kinase [Cyanobium sp. Morenito 9A2]MCP9850597.1 HAMP domain-containing histidine kinase [Cyanobium sp. Morenito 9A2]
MSDTSLEALRRNLAKGVPPGHCDEDAVRRQWWAALATLQDDLLQPRSALRGVWLASPLPALYEPELLRHLRGWVWAPEDLGNLLGQGAPMLPGSSPEPGSTATAGEGFERLALENNDGTDPLLLVITPRVQVALALHGPPERRQLLVRFDPVTLSATLTLLDQRLRRSNPEAGQRLRSAIGALGPLHGDDATAPSFWPRLAERLATMAPSVTLQPLVHGGGGETKAASSELALLEALTHEVRTPLATIRTLIRSLLRRADLPALVRQRLHAIDGECSEQIDRFGLIFHAAELQRMPRNEQPLARTDLAQLLMRLEQIWQQQLQRRDLGLILDIAPDLPPVLSDPSRLETMLGGLIDRFSRRLPSGSTVQISLQPAGSRLKLRLHGVGRSECLPAGHGADGPSAEVVGPVLSWSPETGSLQLSRQATQRLFHSLGGRLTERGDRGLTVFFPLAGSGPAR